MKIVIHCSDPREEADLERKIADFLLDPEEQFVRVTLLGGPLAFAYPEVLKSECLTLLRQIRFSIKHLSADEITLVGHNCGFYSEIHVKPVSKKNDLIKAARSVADYFRQVKVTAVFEETIDGETVFLPVFWSEGLAPIAPAR